MIRGMNRTLKKCEVFNASIHNRFDIEVKDVRTGATKQRAQAFNVICDNLWSKLFSQTQYFKYIHYGGGSGTPSSSDKSLFSYIGNASVSPTGSVNMTTGIYSMKGSIQLSASTAVGETITEVGIAYGTGTSTLCTHAMLQDMNGNPISIEKTETDVVNIYATVFVHFNPRGYDKGSIRVYYDEERTLLSALAGGDLTYFPNNARASNSVAVGTPVNNVTYYPAILTASGVSDGSKLGLTTTFDLASKTITFKVGRLESPSYNNGGIRMFAIAYDYSGGSVFQFKPSLIVCPGGDWFPESTVTNEAVGTGDGSTKDFSLDFQYAKDVVVYIDGVVTNEFSVDYAPVYANANNYIHCFEYLKSGSSVDNHIPNLGGYKIGSGGVRRFYNPNAETLGIGTMTVPGRFTVEASQNLIDWVEVFPYQSSKRTSAAVPEGYRNHKYWRVKNVDASDSTFITAAPAVEYSGKVLHFDNPPPEGSVITADYKCDCIAKDVNHVFDLTVIIQLGEYTEAQ